MVDLVLPNNVFYSFFLPFLAITVILFALLIKMKVFDSRISMLVSIIIALFVLEGGNYPIITKFLSGGGFLIMLAFFVVFIIWLAKKAE